MDRRRQHLNILFRRIQPEILLANIRHEKHLEKRHALYLNSHAVSDTCYLHFAREDFPGLSDNELENMHLDMQSLGTDPDTREFSVFRLLPQFANDVLTLQQRMPVCRADKILSWREISFPLGQDLLTTAYLAWHDTQTHSKIDRFDWPPIICTDDKRLQALLQQGIHENHFHLTGSTQIFPLSWMCLMNHPHLIGQYLHDHSVANRMFENLQGSVNYGIQDAQMPWDERLYYAAELRAELFIRLEYGRTAPASVPQQSLRNTWEAFELSLNKLALISEKIDWLRFRRRHQFLQPNGRYACLDYAIPADAPYLGNGCHNRALTGEREFLYRCFSACFTHIFTYEEEDLFYLYLLLKSQFRSELIQVNGRVGFHNFSAYQDRKDDFWGEIPEYCAEAYRIAVLGTMHSGAVTSLEARMGPRPTATGNFNQILQTDQSIVFAQTGDLSAAAAVPAQTADEPYFYVLHFIKRKLQISSADAKPHSAVPRNAGVRKRAKQCAKSLALALSRNDYLCRRIRGIDAASFEIGCRPETFAVEFRFLRGFVPQERPATIMGTQRIYPRLSASYHVGEDFLDIADGLRAIDESIRFLQLTRGDRLGHALALGIDPKQHYALKGNQIVLPKQDHLDNLVWIVYRSIELGIHIPADYRAQLVARAQQLFDEIYGNAPCYSQFSYSMLDYYQTWKLRGDCPELYVTGLFEKPTKSTFELYENFLYIQDNELTHYRMQHKNTQLYHDYHFDWQVKKAGQEIIVVDIDERYQALMRQLQDQMQREVVAHGIAIECNPTSNYLIGTFQRYDQHPILRFNRYSLDQGNLSSSAPQISVSINTDDQGVFDTSLENEYALIAGCLRWQKENGKQKYSDDAIYTYLNHIREMGNLQTFPRAD